MPSFNWTQGGGGWGRGQKTSQLLTSPSPRAACFSRPSSLAHPPEPTDSQTTKRQSGPAAEARRSSTQTHSVSIQPISASIHWSRGHRAHAHTRERLIQVLAWRRSRAIVSCCVLKLFSSCTLAGNFPANSPTRFVCVGFAVK